MSAASLDVAFVRSRRIERDLSLRDVADAVGLSEAGWRRIEAGWNGTALTLGQLAALAALLGVQVGDLLTATGPSTDPATAHPLEPRLGPLLLVAGRAVPIGTLAAVLGATTEDVERAVVALRDRLAPAGLVVNVGKPGVTLVPGARSLRDAAFRDLLRVGDLRGAVPGPAARMLHRLARGKPLPQSPKRDERARLAVLLRGGWVSAGVGRRAADRAIRLHPDVRFSLALDEGYACEPAVATAQPTPRRKRLPWLADMQPAPEPR